MRGLLLKTEKVFVSIMLPSSFAVTKQCFYSFWWELSFFRTYFLFTPIRLIGTKLHKFERLYITQSGCNDGNSFYPGITRVKPRTDTNSVIIVKVWAVLILFPRARRLLRKLRRRTSSWRKGNLRGSMVVWQLDPFVCKRWPLGQVSTR